MAAGVDTSPGVGPSAAINRYWTAGPGLAKWRNSPTPYRTLVALLMQYIKNENVAKGLAAEYYHRVFGKWTRQATGRQRMTHIHH